MSLAYDFLQLFIEKDKQLQMAGEELASYKCIEVNSEDDVSALMLLHETEKWNGWVKVGDIDPKTLTDKAKAADWNVQIIEDEVEAINKKRKNRKWEAYTGLNAATVAKDLEKFVKKMKKREALADRLAGMGIHVVKTVEDVKGLQKMKAMTKWNSMVSIHKTAPEAVLKMVVDAKFRIQDNPVRKEKMVQTPLQQGQKRKK